MSKILIIYSSVHGQTRKISEHIGKRLIENGNQVVTCCIEQVPLLGEFDKIIIGASIRHGKHNAEVYNFIATHLVALEAKSSCFFSVSLVARKAGRNTPETNPYMQAFLSKTQWRPNLLKVFAGNLDYQGYNWLDRSIIRFIMWITKGPTAVGTKIEYTDWQRVDVFVKEIELL
ncbi:menaquinone-dependent protoporphyrinogen IX dehydrogenase [Shewanella sp. YLB-07]|uniref:menaquinone-dependent protoporphyrinogen IX dehydrogenase n=1 Tax=Shewanella sp. YLB-07 TaxID=2601268 RepID=UPI0012CD441E|nr:menaquinone-dependent protoporphyrinogen IX dehydrogenase [Shewanella sp. YLB-07]MPY22940.1 menaquinone-dependent protoporphyrinogen IX dehydrogenase [Shewanella sp. YLB-07]